MKKNQELARTNRTKNKKSTPRCTLLRGPSCEGNTPTAALAYSLYISSVYKYRVLLELYQEW